MKTNCAVLVCVLLLPVSAAAQEVNNPAYVQAIKDASAAWDRAWSAGDCDAVASLYVADAVVMPPNNTATVGRDAIRESCKKYFAQFRETNRGVVKGVRVSGDLAVDWGTQEGTTTAKTGGASVQYKQKWMAAYLRQSDGSWKILWEIFNSDLPLGGPGREAP